MADDENEATENRCARCCKRCYKFLFTRPDCWVSAARVFTLVFLLFAIWAIAISLFGYEVVGHENQMFRLVVLFVLGKILGVIVGFAKIPPMMGMLAMGILLRNIKFVELSRDSQTFVGVLRSLALVNILLPAGLGLDPIALKKLSWLVLAVSLAPPTLETITVMIMSFWLLKLPWIWGLLLGILLSAVGPAVVIPCLFELQDRGYGTDKGIHTLVIAACTINDIVCITGFNIVVGVIYSKGSLTMELLEGPIVIAMGLAYGIVLGFLAWWLPDKRDSQVIALRTLFIGVGSILASVGSNALGFAGAGNLGCIIGAFVAAIGWRFQGWTILYNPVKVNFSILWKFFEPISFGLIGIELDLMTLEGYTVLWGIISMTVGLLFRCLLSFGITFKSYLNLKESTFVALSWIPKATVQAALGPVALDYARKMTPGDEQKKAVEYATNILLVAAVSIVISTPIGALFIMQLGPRLMTKSPPAEEEPKT